MRCYSEFFKVNKVSSLIPKGHVFRGKCTCITISISNIVIKQPTTVRQTTNSCSLETIFKAASFVSHNCIFGLKFGWTAFRYTNVLSAGSYFKIFFRKHLIKMPLLRLIFVNVDQYSIKSIITLENKIYTVISVQLCPPDYKMHQL